MTESTAPTPSRIERILAYMAVAVVAIALIALMTLLIAAASGMIGTDFAVGAWPVIGLLPLVGFPTGILLILALLITTTVRRARGAQSDTAK